MNKVMIMCSGLGHVSRGYESFSQELYLELLKTKKYEVFLLKGKGGSKGNESSILSIRRNSKIASSISRFFKISTYDLEQYSFFIFSIPSLLKIKPGVIVYSDFILGVMLWHLRKWLNLEYKLLFSNGAPNGPPFTRCDHVQQLLPCHYETGLKGGTPPEKQSVIPYGISMNESDIYFSPDVNLLRSRLNLPQNKKIVVSVGAINQSHKRMCYLIEEFALLQDKGYFLLILGQQTIETKGVMELAAKLLHPNNYLITSVNHDQVSEFYQASDIFVLCSFSEGLPRVSIEAMSHGLPIIIHDYDIAHQTLGDNAWYIDMSVKNSLTNAILTTHCEKEKQVIQKQMAFNTYSWIKLIPSYTSMINSVAKF
ncbi:MAG: glycosyltransferase family 4 protein [Opitutaceae bacterium]|nr:glycosyltransferase family 4 protein [Cytophagales bacterium]